MEQRLTRLWYRESAGPSLLQPLAWIFGLVVRLRRRAYSSGWLRSQGAGRPVVVVGNLTVGGTGKTPLVAWLAGRLSDTGLKVGIVSRGYGRSERAPRVVHADTDWREVGDEPILLHGLTGCDIVVARDRVAGARDLVARGADVIVSDDGLQHLRLARDCEIVVIDGARGFGNGRLLPAGPLREPRSALSRAAIAVVNGAASHASLMGEPENVTMTLFGEEAHRVDGLASPRLLDSFRGQRVHAIAGIGNPDRFFSALAARGMDVLAHPYPDHHPFTAAELTFADELPVLMTQKDAVRCRLLTHPRLWFVPVVARFSEVQARELLDRVYRALGQLPARG